MKPHIYKAAGRGWYCLEGHWLGWGDTPKQAFDHWLSRHKRYSCVHQRETALQRRRMIAMRYMLATTALPVSGPTGRLA